MQADGALRNRTFTALVVSAMLTAVLAATGARTPVSFADMDSSLYTFTGDTVPVIVQKSVQTTSPERDVVRLGGRITQPLWIVNGFAADVPAASVRSLATLSGVRAVTLDRKVHVLEGGGTETPKSVYPKVIRSDQMNGYGYTGSGVTVALIDTGVADTPDTAGRVLTVTDNLTGAQSPCVNLSGEPDCNDSYGHGTFMAGIIAGNGAASGGKWKGAAPEASIVSVKIAGADGSADVSNVLSAIQWVVSFKDDYGIRVLNLSLGTNGTQTYRTDPMNYAVERAWAAGIAVVVAAGNLGPNPGSISKPGDDPFVITVGAIDDNGTVGTGDDRLPNFSAHGPTAADGITKPDVTAPGAHIVSLRAPGSSIDTLFPNYVDGSYRKGSGTSMAAAAVSGSIATLLQANPSWVPDRVKYALKSTTRHSASSDAQAVGAGLVDVASARTAPPGIANIGLTRSNGMGSLDDSRGDVVLQTIDDPFGTLINGMTTAQLLLWDPISYTTGEWNGYSWHTSQWYGYSWHATSWYGYSWHGYSWHGATMEGQPEDSAWYGYSWHGSAWYGAWE